MLKDKIDIFCDQAGVGLGSLVDLMGDLYSPSISFADIFAQQLSNQSISLEDDIIKVCSYSAHSGVGFRAVHQEQIGFSYAQSFNIDVLRKQAHLAKIPFNTDNCIPPDFNYASNFTQRYSDARPDLNWDNEKYKTFLHQLNTYAKKQNPHIKQVMLSLNSSFSQILIINEKGKVFTDFRPLIRFDVKVICEKTGIVESGYVGGGGRLSFDAWFEKQNPELMIDNAIKQAMLAFEAKAAPAGEMEVVLGSGWPGILLHEAVGHCLEADFNRKKTSIYSDSIGNLVASPLCTVIDDATLQDARGSINIDDEGTPGQKNVLIENGVLKNYLYDRQNALLMGTTSTGNGRRESFESIPMPRMTNTYLAPGSDHPDDIIASVEDGLYAVQFGGGSVDITSGQFVFSASEAYRVKNGKILYPVKGATFIGVGPEVMKNITMLGHDWAMDEGVGTCGKNGQQVVVGVGQPTVKIQKLVVGGTHDAE